MTHLRVQRHGPGEQIEAPEGGIALLQQLVLWWVLMQHGVACHRLQHGRGALAHQWQRGERAHQRLQVRLGPGRALPQRSLDAIANADSAACVPMSRVPRPRNNVLLASFPALDGGNASGDDGSLCWTTERKCEMRRATKVDWCMPPTGRGVMQEGGKVLGADKDKSDAECLHLSSTHTKWIAAGPEVGRCRRQQSSKSYSASFWCRAETRMRVGCAAFQCSSSFDCTG